MSTPRKIGLGLLTFYPFAYVFVFFAFVFGTFFLSMLSAGQDADPSPLFAAGFFVIFPLHCLTILVAWGLTAFYVVHVLTRVPINDASKILWVALLLMTSMMATPFYWYLYIWRDDPWDPLPQGISSAPAASSSPLSSVPDSPASQGPGDNATANRSEDLPGGPEPDRHER